MSSGAHDAMQASQTVCTNMMTDVKKMFDVAESDSQAGMPAADRAFSDDAKRCSYDRFVNAGNGFANYARAISLHRTGDGWQPPLTLAITQLTKCSADFPSSKTGANCDKALAGANKHLTEWSAAASASPSPASTAKP
ncbi:MAG: hypothetical protein IAI49_09325 [Candidatus Eremiobacteraeota bacterium]|nr:hypothetical protein [Candidatus Eremiobacteraeota bacterium]